MTTIDLSGLPDVTNDIYLPLYTDDSTILIIYGGAGSGKSRFIGQKHMYRILTERGHRLMIVRKVGRTLRESVFQLMQDYVHGWGLSQFFKINKSEMKITYLPNGNEIIFFGLDDVEKLKSIERISSIWIEEASEVTQDDYEQLRLRLRGYKHGYMQMILSFNPISAEHWIKKYFFDNADDIEEPLKIVKSTYRDNRFIDEQYKRALEGLKKTNLQKYKIYALGEWGVLKGLIYDQYKVIDEMPEDFESEFFGVDFGWNDPTAVVHVRKIGQKLYIDELLYQSQLTNADVIKLLNQGFPLLKRLQGYFDWAEPDRLEEFRRAGYYVNRAKKNILLGISKVKEYELHITKQSVNILREIAGYVWREDRNGNPIDEPVDLDNHAMDAIRYAVFTWSPAPKKLSGSVDI